MADALVQKLGTTNGTALTSLTLTISGTGNTTVGNTIVVAVIHHASNATVSCADSGGNTYQQDAHVWDTVSQGATIFSSPTVTSLTNNTSTITVSFTNSVNNVIVFAYEFSGLKVLSYVDQASAVHTSGNSPTSGNLVTTNADDLLFALLGWSNTSASVAVGSGYTKLDEADGFHSATNSALTEYQLVEATGTYVGNATLTGSPSSVVVAAVAYEASTGVAPVNTVAPAVTGTAHVGQTLSTTSGTWTDDGSPTFTYQWQRDNAGGGVYSNITGATSITYQLTAADDGCHVRCAVTDSTPDGATLANSNAVSVTYSAPINTMAPALTGTATIGSLLSCDTGTWST